jgi:hypothetical protein
MDMQHTRTIASFDIGIKNMAFCVASNPETPKILKWDIINLTSAAAAAEPPAPSPPPEQCTYCKNRAKFTRANKLFCRRHITRDAAEPKTLTWREHGALKKYTVEKLHEFMTTHKIDIESLQVECTARKERLTKSRLLEYIESQIAREFFMPFRGGGGGEPPKAAAADIDLITVGRNMKAQLDRIFTPELCATLTDIFIENQIGTLAMRMKTIQGMLTQYFIFVAPHAQIRYISASLKLRDANLGGAKGNDAYKKRKKASIEQTEKILGKTPDLHKWRDFFMSYGAKRDDLADCFLQILGGVAAAPAPASVRRNRNMECRQIVETASAGGSGEMDDAIICSTGIATATAANCAAAAAAAAAATTAAAATSTTKKRVFTSGRPRGGARPTATRSNNIVGVNSVK